MDDVIQRLGISLASKCVLCDHCDSLQHGFLECEVALQLWGRMADKLGVTLSIYGSLKDLFGDCWRYQGEMGFFVRLLPVVISWTLWVNRCAAKYDNRPQPIARLLASAMGVLHDNAGLIPAGSVRRQIIVIVRWVRPLCWKLNTDGSSLSNGMAGGGAIIRDHLGNVLAAEAYFFGQRSCIFA